MYELEIILTNDQKTVSASIKKNSLEEVKYEEENLILKTAKDAGMNREVNCETIITKNGEYVDSDEDVLKISEDYSIFEVY